MWLPHVQIGSSSHQTSILHHRVTPRSISVASYSLATSSSLGSLAATLIRAQYTWSRNVCAKQISALRPEQFPRNRKLDPQRAPGGIPQKASNPTPVHVVVSFDSRVAVSMHACVTDYTAGMDDAQGVVFRKRVFEAEQGMKIPPFALLESERFEARQGISCQEAPPFSLVL